MKFSSFYFFFLTLFVFLQIPVRTSAAEMTAKILQESNSSTTFIKKKLKAHKFSPAFIKSMLKNYEVSSFESTLRLNMLGFLNPTQHAFLVTEQAVIKSEEFISKNKKTFIKIEKRDKVPASVIAALLWIETQHGNLTGHYHVASVFLHMIQLSRKSVFEPLYLQAKDINKEKDLKIKNLRKKMLAKAEKKVNWAYDQLHALEKLYKKDRKMVESLEGSFAGAFGIPQFIPTSYFTYARPYQASHVADLYKPEDAISSVGHYLKKTGWNSKKKKNKMKALMHYNNSEDYAESILDLSQRIVQEFKK